MDIKALNKCSGQRIKEMVANNTVAIEDLDASSLRKLMTYEIDLLCLDKGDIKLIERCSNLLSLKENEDVPEGMFESAIGKARERVEIVDGDSGKNKKTTKRASFKKAALIAAAVVLVAANMTVLIAAAFGVDIFAYIKELSSKPAGTTIVVDNFTFQNTGEPKEYSSLDEMLKSEGIDIIYPTKWPNDADITDVYVLDSGRNTTELLILTSDPSISMDVELGLSEEGADLQGELYVSHGITFHLYNNGMCYACCFYGGNYYDIKANNFDELRYIIDNLKM